MKVIKKVDILSVARVTGIITGGIYLVAGLFINVIVLLFGIPALSNFDILGFGSGMLATFLVALVIDAVSFIMGAVWAWLYNLAATLVGGVAWHEVEVERSMFKKVSKGDEPKKIDPQAEVNQIINSRAEDKKEETFSSNDPNFLNS